jgi:hypothetical protein
LFPRIGYRSDLEEIGAETAGPADLGTQAANPRSGIKVVKGHDTANSFAFSLLQQCRKSVGRSKLNVDVAGQRQKLAEQVCAFFARQISGTAFAATASGNDERRRQSRYAVANAIVDVIKVIEPNLEQIRRLVQGQCPPQSGLAGYYPNQPNTAPGFFERFRACHILGVAEKSVAVIS